MFDVGYKIAELNDRADALEAIRQLERQLTDQLGTTISLIAYETEDEG
ncbi:hypothetical protein [Paenibacillus sp. NPDC058071]